MSETLTTPNYKEMEYSINRVKGFSFSLAVSIWKTQHQTFDKFERIMRNNYEGTEFNDFFDVIKEAWDVAPELTKEQAFSAPNIEHRRVIFNVIGVDKLMKELEPELLDKQTITRKNILFNNDGSMNIQDLVDTYELYKIDSNKLFDGVETERRWRTHRDENVYAVKCKDASTDREYWIYVHPDAVKEEIDALSAIAWTYQMKNSVNTNSIYRQGEVIIAKHDGDEPAPGKRRWGQFYHLDKEDYLTKIKAQS